MRNLFKWQFISFISRGMAMLLGLVQSFVIIRVLTQSEWGIVQLALSIGGALGIYQHLGLASASTREIAASKDDTKIFKVFLTSIAIRYVITLPLAIGLLILAPKIATDVYKHPELIFPLQVYGVTILFQGFQSILNSVISGTKRFKHLFIYQVAIAFVGTILYIPLVYFYGVRGYFYAFLAFNVIATFVLSYLAFAPLKGKLLLPTKKDFAHLFKDIFSISIVIYVVKILYTNWEKFGANVLGLNNTAELVAIYGFALLFAKKIMNISDAVTDVNLPVLSEKFVDDFNDFKETFNKNFDKIFAFIILSSSVAAYWAPEIIYFAAGADKYREYYNSLPLILPLLVAFIMYSFINIVKSSMLIPAKLTKTMLLSFVYLLGSTAFSFGVFYYLHYSNILMGMAVSMMFGGVISYFYICRAIEKKLKFSHFTVEHLLVLLQGISIGYASTTAFLWVKVVLFAILLPLLVAGVMVAGFLTKSELNALKNKGFSILKQFKLAK